MNPNTDPLLNNQEPGSLDAHQLEAVASQQVIGLDNRSVPVAKKIRSTTGIWTATAGLLVLGLITLIGFIFIRTNENAKTVPTPLAEFSQVTTNEINLGQLGQVDVNGVLKVNNGIILSPTTLNPADPQPGQLFLNQDTNKLEFYDGNEVKQVVTETQIVTTIGGSAGQINVGEGLVFENNTISLENLNTTPVTPTGLQITNNSDGLIQRINGILTGGVGDRNNAQLFGGILSLANGGTGASSASGVRSNIGAASSGANTDITSLSGLTTALSVFQGGTGASNLALNGVLIGGGSGSVSSLVAGSSGLCLISTSGTPAWSSCSGGGTVASVNTFTGAISIQGTTNQVNINNSSGTITLSLPQNIHTSASPQFSGLTLSGLGNGVVQSSSGVLSASAIDRNSTTLLSNDLSVVNGGTGASDAATARSNLGAASSGANSDITSLSGLTTALSVAQGGTGATTLGANGVLLGNGTGSISSVVAGGAGLCLTSTAGAPTWSSCPGSGGVSSVNTFTGAVSIQGTANQVNISNSSGTITLSLPQNLNTTSSPQFSGLTLTSNLVVQGGSATLGTTSQAGGLIIYDGSSNTGTLQTAALGQNTVYTLPDPGLASVSICLSTGNCAGLGGGVTTTGGTNGAIALFNSANNIEESILTQSGSTVTAAGNLVLQGTNSLSLGTASTNAGSIAFYNTAGANTVSLQAPSTNPASNLVFRLPVADGSSGNCLTTNGTGTLSFAACLSGAGGGSGGVSGLNGLSGSLTIANASGSLSTITIDNASTSAKGIASFNSSDFTVTSGAVSIANDAITSAKIDDGTITGSDIASGTISNSNLANSSVTVTAGTGLSGGGAVALGASTTLNVAYGSTTGTAVQGDIVLTCPSGSGNLSGGGTNITLGLGGTCGGITTVNNPTFTTSVTSAQLILTGAGSNGTLQVANLGQATTFTLPDPGAASATICLSTGNCAGSGTGVTTAGGSTNTLAKFTGSQSIGDSSITDNGTTVTIGANLNVTGAVTLTTPLAVAEGGTGADNATTARSNLGAAASGANSDITSLSGLTTALTVAQGGTGATTLTANGVLFGNGTGAIQATAAGSTGQCLIATTGNAPTWGSCAGGGSGVTLQAAYDNSTGGTTPEIKLDSTRGGLDIQDANSTIGGSLLTVRASNASGLGSALFDINSTGQTTLRNSTNSTSAFQIQNAAATRTLFSVDTANNRVGIGTASPGAALEISDGTDGTRFGLLTNGGINLHTSNSAGDITINPGGDVEIGTALTDSITLGRTDSNITTTINGSVISRSQTNSATAFLVQDTASASLFTVDTAIRSVSGGNLIKIGNSTGTDTATTILQVDSATADPTSNLSALNGGLFYNSTSNKLSIIENGTVKVLCNTTDLSCGNSPTTTLQQAYDNGVAGDQIIALDGTQDSIIFRNPASSGSDSNYVLTVDQLSTGATGGLEIQSAGTGNLLRVRDTTATALDVLTIADGGATTFRSQTDSATAFQIQNAAGTQVFGVNTSSTNIVTNPSAELSFSGNWTAKGSSTVSQNSTEKYIGDNSVRVATTLAANDGVEQSVTLSNVSYNLTAYVKLDAASAAMATFAMGYNQGSDSNCATAKTLVSTSWIRYACTFTPAAGAGTIYFKQTDGVAHTFYVDAIQLIPSSSTTNPYRDSTVNINGVITSPVTLQNQSNSRTAFQVLNVSGQDIFSVNTESGIVGTQNTDISSTNTRDFTVRTGNAFGSSSNSGSLLFDVGTATGITGQILIGTVNSASAITVGSTAQTGTITLGQSTATNTIAIGASAGASNTQTINIGTSSTGSSTTNVNIGSSAGGTVALQGPTTITNRTSGSTSSLIVSNSTSTGNIAEFRDNATNVFSLADGGAATFRNQTDGTTAFNIQNAAGTTLLSANTTDLNVTVTGDLKISKRSDVAGGWSKISQTTAGTLAEDGGSTTGIDGIGASAVYNGSLYVGTGDSSGSTAEIYRYDGGSNWTKVSQATAGTIAEDGGSTTGIAKIWAMAVYNGNLYVGTQKTSQGEIYRYDGGSNWTKVSQTTAGTIASGGTSGISSAQTLTVYQGNLYVGTFDGGGTEVYRYEGGTTWTRVSNAVGQIDSGGTTNLQDVFGFAVHNDKLHIAVAGSGTGNTAEVYRYEGGTDWTKITPAGVTDQIVSGGTTGIDKVRTIHSYNGTLLIGTTKDGGGAEVYRYDGGTTWTKITQSTAGQIASGGNTGIIGVEAATVYNGKYYIGTRKLTSGGDAEVYRYDGGTTWTKISQSTEGTIIPSGTTDIDEIDTMVVFNNRIYLGTSKTNEAEALYYEAIEGESYRLTFGAASDETATEQSNFLNEGSIKFLAENQAGSVENWANTGTFEFSHGITTTFGAYDVAEDYPTRDNDILPGTVVSIDQNETGFVTRTNTKQDSTIVGIYSEKPGLRLSQTESHIEGARAIPVALAGRVPVLVTDENGPIMPGDYLTSSSTPGYAMKATQPGPTIGKALGSHMAGTGKLMAFVNISYYSPSTGDILHNQEIKTGALNVQGSAEISGSLNVGGMLEVEELEVKGSVAIEGNLMVAGSISTKNITINGHIKTAGQTPQIDIAGGIVLGSNTANPAVAIDGNDTSGTITINTENLINPILPGEIVKVTFAESFSKSPKVFINASNADSSSIDIYRESNTDSMLLNITSPLMPGKQYKFDYLVIE